MTKDISKNKQGDNSSVNIQAPTQDRTKLLGSGIIKGLDFYMDSYCHINLAQGYGISSSGQVISHNQAEFSFYSIYLDPYITIDEYMALSPGHKGAYKYFYGKGAVATSKDNFSFQTDPNQRITQRKHFIFRLHTDMGNHDSGRFPLTPQSITDDINHTIDALSTDPIDESPINIITDLENWVLLLYLEKGPKEVAVPLLLHREDAYEILLNSGELQQQYVVVKQEDEPVGIGSLFARLEKNEDSEAELYNAYHKNLLLADIRMRRFGYGSITKLPLVEDLLPTLPPGITPYRRIYLEYKNLIEKAFVELIEGLDAVHAYFGQVLEKRNRDSLVKFRSLLSARLADYYQRMEGNGPRLASIALGANDQWVIFSAGGNDYRHSSNISEELKVQLNKIANTNRKVRRIVLGPMGQYAIILEDPYDVIVSSLLLDDENFREKFEFLMDSGRDIRIVDLALGNEEQWILTEGSWQRISTDPETLDWPDSNLELEFNRYQAKVKQILLGPTEKMWIMFTDESINPDTDEFITNKIYFGEGMPTTAAAGTAYLFYENWEDKSSEDIQLKQIALYLKEEDDHNPLFLTLFEDALGSWNYLADNGIPLGAREKLAQLNSNFNLAKDYDQHYPSQGTKQYFQVEQLSLSIGNEQFAIMATAGDGLTTGLWHNGSIPFELKKALNELLEISYPGIQYIYSFIKDLTDTYNELRAELCDLNLNGFGGEDRFPDHLLLGKPQQEVAFQKSIFRHTFQQPPVYNDNADRLSKIRQLHWRMAGLIQSFSIPDPNFDTGIDFDNPSDEPYLDVLREREDTFPDSPLAPPIKITPSRPPEEPLGRQAIPFYYHLSRSYYSPQHVWDFDMIKRNQENHHFSYHASHKNDSYTQLEQIVQPFAFKLEDYRFYRIEGHLNKQLYPSVDENGNFQRGALWRLLQLRSALGISFDVEAISLVRFLQLYDDRLLYEGFPSVLNDSAPALSELLPQEMIRLMRRHGLEQLGGVRQGSTFLLVYEDQYGSGKRVVADFCLSGCCCGETGGSQSTRWPLVKAELTVKDCNPLARHTSPGNAPLAKVQLQIGDQTFESTDENGKINVALLPGSYTLDALLPEYELKEPTVLEIIEPRGENSLPQAINVMMRRKTALVYFLIHPSDDFILKKGDIHILHEGNKFESDVIEDNKYGFVIKLPNGEQRLTFIFTRYPKRSFELTIEVNSCTEMAYDITLDDQSRSISTGNSASMRRTMPQPLTKDTITDRIGPPAEQADDLKEIKGIGTVIEEGLNRLGINSFEQISRMKAEDMRAIEKALNLYLGKACKEDWVGQALNFLGK